MKLRRHHNMMRVMNLGSLQFFCGKKKKRTNLSMPMLPIGTIKKNQTITCLFTPPRNRGGVIFSLQFVCVCLSVCLCVCVCLFVCLSVFLSVSLSIFMSICRRTKYKSFSDAIFTKSPLLLFPRLTAQCKLV